MDWILENKEWLFSGLGLVAISGIVLLLRRVVSRRWPAATQHGTTTPLKQNGTPVPPQVLPPSELEAYNERPYPAEIVAEINSAPPFQRSSRAHHYVGLRVRWDTTLEGIRDPVEEVASLMLLDRGKYPWVYSSVAIDDYPQLKIASKGTKIGIAGRITGCTISGVTVDADILEISGKWYLTRR